MPKREALVLVTISREAARVLRRSTALEHQYGKMARTIRGGRVVSGRWICWLTSQEARDLLSWCIHQADRVRPGDADGAAVLDGAATDIAATVVARRPSRASDSSGLSVTATRAGRRVETGQVITTRTEDKRKRICLVCEKPIQQAESHYRRGLAWLHITCYDKVNPPPKRRSK
jgi:hypothetical protein